MASSLVENKPDSVKHFLVLINHSDQRCTRWKIRGMIRLELRRVMLKPLPPANNPSLFQTDIIPDLSPMIVSAYS
jgi:hypothetical protein